jgi:hypothetical protein
MRFLVEYFYKEGKVDPLWVGRVIPGYVYTSFVSARDESHLRKKIVSWGARLVSFRECSW